MKFKGITIGAIAALLLLGSCTSSKDISYFQDLTPQTEYALQQLELIKFRPNDKVAIIVSTPDGRLNSLFNLPLPSTSLGGGAYGKNTGAETGSGNTERVATYTVNSQGDIDFPVLGKLHIAGMTREELGEYIRRELVERDLAKTPIVTVEYMNLGVTVLGEVGSPGFVRINRDDFTILDAIAASGDLTLMGKRKNIMVIRDVNGKQKVYTIDITNDRAMTQSPAYYLQQKDIVYVEPSAVKARTADPNGNSWLTPGFWMGMLSFVASVSTWFVVRK